MLWFLCRRAVWMVLTFWAVFTISFFMLHAVPGNPLATEKDLPKPVMERMIQRYHYDDPLDKQYWRELGNFCRGDLGISLRRHDFTVNQIVAQGLPISAALGIFALAFAIVVGLASGIAAALWRNSLIDVSLRTIATIGIALPSFVIAGVSIILFVFMVPLFPAAGWGSLSQVVLPAICVGAPFAAYIARLARTGVLDVLGQDYIRTAYAKGLPRRTVILRHALKGALLPVVSFLGPAIAGVLTGTLVAEQIFAIPGLGVYFIQGAMQHDLNLILGLTMLYTVLLYAMNLLVDVLYTFLDPRIKLE